MSCLHFTRHKALVAMVFMSVLVIQGCTFPVKQMEFSAIEGQVLDEETGAPIEGAVVYVHWQEGKESLAERYPAGSLFVAETVTDGQGHFRLPKGGPIDLPYSRHLHYNSPLLGIIKDGYGIYHTTLTHDTSSAFPNRQLYTPGEKRCCTFTLKKMSVREIVVGEGSSHSSFASTDLEWIAHSDCWWEKIPQTIAAMDRLAAAADTLNLGVGVFSSKDIPSNNGCKDTRAYFE